MTYWERLLIGLRWNFRLDVWWHEHTDMFCEEHRELLGYIGYILWGPVAGVMALIAVVLLYVRIPIQLMLNPWIMAADLKRFPDASFRLLALRMRRRHQEKNPS